MVFSSLTFLTLFLPSFLGIYHLCPDRIKNPLALVGSLIFYTWGAPGLVLFLVPACAVDYWASLLLARDWEHPSTPKWIAGIAISFNLGFLAYFKYANFLVHQVNRLLPQVGLAPLAWSDVALPIGISFFTFHRISYIADVYRKSTSPARCYADYLLYIFLFPHMIAGPIIRYKGVAAAIAGRRHTTDQFFRGISRFALGLSKKVLVANTLGEVVDRIFAMAPESISSAHAWLGILCYAFQIYFDFSGYSDMAIGMAGMIGIVFPENFDSPYISSSITEFWRRWHISLSAFMRDYLYIPLGGNRVGRLRLYFNLWVVFLLSGFWHGASWNFLLWGAWHGLFLAAERAFLLKLLTRVPRPVAVTFTFLIILFGWVLFRSPDLSYALHYTSRMLGSEGMESDRTLFPWRCLVSNRALFTLAVAAVASFIPAWGRFCQGLARGIERLSEGTLNRLKFIGIMVAVILSLAYLCSSTANPFIYFRF